MKKVLIASAALFIAAITNVNAQTESNQPPVQQKPTMEKPQQVEQLSKSPVKPEALPEAVIATTKTEPYSGWLVSSAFLVKGAAEYYELTFTKENETKSVKLDKDGKPVL